MGSYGSYTHVEFLDGLLTFSSYLRFSRRMTEPGAGSAHAASTSAPTQSGRKVTSLEKKSDITRTANKSGRYGVGKWVE